MSCFGNALFCNRSTGEIYGIIRKVILKLAEAEGMNVDFTKGIVCLKSNSSMCVPLNDWCKSLIASIPGRISALALQNTEARFKKLAYRQGKAMSCWAATGIILKQYQNASATRKTEDQFFRDKMRLITVTQKMLDAKKETNGVFSGFTSAEMEKVNSILNNRRDGETLDFADSLKLYDVMTNHTAIASTADLKKLRLYSFFFNNDPDQTGMKQGSEKYSFADFLTAYFAVLYRCGASYWPVNKGVERWYSLAGELAAHWFHEVLGFQVRSYPTFESRNRLSAADIQRLLQLGPFIINVSLDLYTVANAEASSAQQSNISHYIIIYWIDSDSDDPYLYYLSTWPVTDESLPFEMNVLSFSELKTLFNVVHTGFIASLPE